MENSNYRQIWRDIDELRQMFILSLLDEPKNQYEICGLISIPSGGANLLFKKLLQRDFIEKQIGSKGKRSMYNYIRTDEGTNYMRTYFNRLYLSLKNLTTK